MAMATPTVDSNLYQLAREEVLERVSIPVYFMNHVDSGIDLSRTPYCLCPFHVEDTPSFRYNTEQNYWNCFGACRTGGTVIELHKFKFRLSGHYEALQDLKRRFGSTYGLNFVDFIIDESKPSDPKVIEAMLNDKRKKSFINLDSFSKDKVEKSNPVASAEILLSKIKQQDFIRYVQLCMEFDTLYVHSEGKEKYQEFFVGDVLVTIGEVFIKNHSFGPTH